MLKLFLMIIGGFIAFITVLGGLAVLMVRFKHAQRRRRNRATAKEREYHREVQKIMRKERKQKLRGTYEPAPDVSLNFPFGRVLEQLINR